MALRGFECIRLQLWLFLVTIHDHVGKVFPMFLQICSEPHTPPIRQRRRGEYGLQGNSTKLGQNRNIWVSNNLKT